MKAYFTQLFDFDRYANHLILETMLAANTPQNSVDLMSHLLGAQKVWLSRCVGDPSIGGEIWPHFPVEQLGQIIDGNYKAFTNYLNTLTANDFDKVIYYKNSQGIAFENKLVDILTHVINHGTHHRAQIGQQLKLAGVEKLPALDYIFYLRNL